jgi:hypothetical protein
VTAPSAETASPLSSSVPVETTAQPVTHHHHGALDDSEDTREWYDAPMESLQILHAPNSRPAGRVVMILSAGDRRPTPVTLHPDDCVTFIGDVLIIDGERGPQPDVDLELYDPAGALVQRDSTDDSNPVLGAGTSRICAPAEADYTLVISTERGGGYTSVGLFVSPR